MTKQYASIRELLMIKSRFMGKERLRTNMEFMKVLFRMDINMERDSLSSKMALYM